MGRTSYPPTALLIGVALAILLTACQTWAAPAAGGAAGVPGYRVVRDLPMPGGTTAWDYQVLDAASHRLYVAHPGASQVVVVDTAVQRVAAVVSGIDGVQGLALAPDLGRLYAAATRTNQVAVLDAASGSVIGRVSAGMMPDGLAYVSDVGRVFVSDDDGPGDAVIDARTGTALPGIPLGGDIGETQYDPWNGLVLVAVGTRHELDAIDPGSGNVMSRYGLPGCDQPDGIQVDVASERRVFVACKGNARLLTLDVTTGHVTGAVGVGSAPDVLALDPTLRRLYVASGSGVLTVIDTTLAVPRALARGYAGPNAHSVVVDPDTDIVYLPLTSVHGRPVLRELAPSP